VRLQQSLYTEKRVTSIRLRITATDVPESAAVLITDVQLQSGELATGVVPNPREVGTTQGGAQYRNGVVNNRMTLVALSNADAAAPVRMSVRNAKGDTRVGSYRFGELNGSAVADAREHSATHGWGRPPTITERSNLNMEAFATGRLHLRLAWNERGYE